MDDCPVCGSSDWCLIRAWSAATCTLAHTVAPNDPPDTGVTPVAANDG